MLSDEQIREIEEKLSRKHLTEIVRLELIQDTRELLATVKELRKENTEQRELLRRAFNCLSHSDICTRSKCVCLKKKIEEALK